MKLKIKQTLSILALIALVASISSCNRGYGCPSNFKADVVTQVVKTVAPALIKK